MTDLATFVAALEQALVDRFPGQSFDVAAFAFNESLHVRWYEGPTDYAVQQVANRMTPADVPVVCARWWSAATLQPLVERLAQSYRKPAPQIVEWETAGGLTRAWLAGDTDLLDTYRNALAMQDLYQPPATLEPVAAPPLADYYVAGGGYTSGVVRLRMQEKDGKRVLSFSGLPARTVIDALNGLNAIWNPYSKTWTTGAPLARIQTLIPAR